MADVANSANTLGVNGNAAPNGVAPDGTGKSLPTSTQGQSVFDQIT